jgi:Fe-S cluster assembly scaffold protein SufB
MMNTPTTSIDIDRDVGNFFYDLKPTRDAGVGLTERTIDYIVEAKGEPDWLRQFRSGAYQLFKSKPLPTHWAGDELKEIDFDRIRYYLASGAATKRSWEEVPAEIKQTFERLGIPESERKFLAGVEAQFDSEAAYSNLKKAVSDQGVIFMGSTEALKERPDLFRKWFGKVIPSADNKFSALDRAVFSVGKGRATYRGLVQVPQHLKGCKNNTECDALPINATSRTDTYPTITVRGGGNSTQHEASVSQIGVEQIFYLQQRGLSKGQAMSLAVNGFVNDLVRQFPMEYGVELKRLIDLEMEGSVG